LGFWAGLPPIVWFVLLATLATCFDYESFYGLSLNGILLFVLLGVSLVTTAGTTRRISFPITI
jgi:uncharacterized protein YhhL (DUF1145 family)